MFPLILGFANLSLHKKRVLKFLVALLCVAVSP